MKASIHGLYLAGRAMYETLAISAPTVVDAVLSRVTRNQCNQRLSSWSRRLLEQADVTLTVSGREYITEGQPYLIMSNHQSHYDVPVLFQAFPGTMRMIAKKELFHIPIFGGALSAAGFVEIDRSDRERAVRSLREAKARLLEGVSVWIAPEGTRSRTGELGPFKKGGFVLALQTGLPVLPTAIVGSRNILAAEGRWIRRGARVHVAFRPPIPPSEDSYGPKVRNALMTRVRDEIQIALTEGAASISQSTDRRL